MYGDDPSFGIRELLQNSLDACRERAELQKNENPDYLPEIKISIKKLEEDNYEFILQDNGIGMSQDVLLNYFLKAGSTFRKSLEWKREFSNKDGDSNIQRSGKFGVGVLAAFLLGEEIYVETKRVGNESGGYYFSAKLDDEILEIRKKDRDPGTLIRIVMTEKEIDKLKVNLQYHYKEPRWLDWYMFDYPNIIIELPQDWEVNKKSKYELDRETSQIKGWKRFSTSYFTAIDWSYTGKEILLCNGIIIPQKVKINNFYFPSFPLTPSLSVIDFNGNLPLSLNRNGLNGELPFLKDLAVDICKEILWNLLHLPSVDNISELELDTFCKIEHPALGERSTWAYDYKWGESDILLTKDGYIFPHSYCIEKANIERIVVFWARESTKDVAPSISLDNNLVAYSIQDELSNNSEFKDRLYDLNLRFGHKLLSASQKHMYIHKEEYNHFFLGNRRLTQTFKESVDISFINEEWVCITNGDKFQSNIQEKHLINSIKLAIEYNITEPFTTNPYQTNETLDVMLPILQYYLGENVIIPYSMEERRKLFPKLFKELSPLR